MNKYILIVLLLVACFLLVESKKKKFDPYQVRPRTFDAVIYCNACQAIVRETLKKLHDNKNEVDVAASLDRICKTNFQGYAYVTGSIQLAFIDYKKGWGDYIEEQFQKRKDNKGFEVEFCTNFTKACEGIDPVQFQKERKQAADRAELVTVDGKKYRPNAEGHVDVVNDKPIEEDL